MQKVIFFLFVCLRLGSLAQPGQQVFNDTVLHSLYIETDLPNWFVTLENDYQLNFSNPDLYPEVYRKCKVTWDGTLLNGCGFREKGNSSNSFIPFGKKKPFKISFDEFGNDQLEGLKKINLNNFTNDPSLLHDVVSFKLFRDAGLVAPRTSYTKLWVNGEYIGLYVAIENVDKTFLKFHYGSGNNDGNLYKTDRGAAVPLNWKGPEPEGYKDQGLKLTTNETEDDWTGLIRFVHLLNYDHSPNFRQKLDSSFDVHSYLKILAIEKCIRSWDSYWGGGNNFYLYEHPDGKIRWIPWDMNETFLDLKLLSGISLLKGYLVPANRFDDRPLLKRIFEIEDYKTEYLNYVCEFIQTEYSVENLGKFILDRHNLIDEAYRIDPYRYNSYQAFKNSLAEDNEDEVPIARSGYVIRLHYPGILPFIQSQREWAVEQMNGWDYNCSIENYKIYNLTIFPNPAMNRVNIDNDTSGFDCAQFKLYDFTGKLVQISNFVLMQGKSYALNIEGIHSGIYLLIKISADGKIGRAKVVIK